MQEKALGVDVEVVDGKADGTKQMDSLSFSKRFGVTEGDGVYAQKGNK